MWLLAVATLVATPASEVVAQRAPETPVRETPKRQEREHPKRKQPTEDPQSCCRVCDKGKACGNTCINRRLMCHKPPGCACNAGSH
jgi:hypothetical protein